MITLVIIFEDVLESSEGLQSRPWQSLWGKSGWRMGWSGEETVELLVRGHDGSGQ